MLRRERRRDAKARLGVTGHRRKKKSAARTQLSQRPAALARPPSRSLKRPGTGARIPSREGDGRVPSPDRLDPPPGPRWCKTAAAATRGGSRGTGDDNRQLGLGHLRDNPERSRSTTDGRAKRARAPKGRHAARRRDGPNPTAGKEGRSRHTAKGRAERVRRVRRPRATPAAVRQEAGARGRAGVRTPSLPRTAMGCRRGEGPAGGARRAVPFARNVRPSSGAA